jgi:hypothetical protein
MFGDKVSREEINQLEIRVTSNTEWLQELSMRSRQVEWTRQTCKKHAGGELHGSQRITMTTSEAIKLLADAIGMEFQTEAATPSKTVLVKKTEENVNG